MSSIISNSLIEVNFCKSEHYSQLAESIMKFFVLESHLDLFFICKDSISVGAHKVILVSVSKFLKQLISDEKDVVYISLPGVDSGKLRILINFVYEGVTKVNRTELLALKEIMLLLDIRFPEAEIRPASNLENRVLSQNTNVFTAHNSVIKNTTSSKAKNIHEREDCDYSSIGKSTGATMHDELETSAGAPYISKSLESLLLFEDGIIDLHLPTSSFLQIKQEIVNGSSGFTCNVGNSESVTTDSYYKLMGISSDLLCGEENGKLQSASPVSSIYENFDTCNSESLVTNDSVCVSGVASSMRDESVTHENEDSDCYSEHEEFSDSCDDEMIEESLISCNDNLEDTSENVTQDIQGTENVSLQDNSEADTNKTVDKSVSEEGNKVIVNDARTAKLFTDKQIENLEKSFQGNKLPTVRSIIRVAKQLNLPQDHVLLWLKKRNACDGKGNQPKNVIRRSSDRSSLKDFQRCELEKAYLENKYLNSVTVSAIAEKLGIPKKSIYKWFCLRRTKERRGSMFRKSLPNIEQSAAEIETKEERESEPPSENSKDVKISIQCSSSDMQKESNSCEQEENLDASGNANKESRKEDLQQHQEVQARFFFNEQQKLVLEKTYQDNQFPKISTLFDIADSMQAPGKSVINWFANRRSKDRRDDMSKKLLPSPAQCDVEVEVKLNRIDASKQFKNTDNESKMSLAINTNDLNRESCVDSSEEKSVPYKKRKRRSGTLKEDEISGSKKRNENTFTCNVCKRKFVNSHCLKAHSCTKDKKYKCDFCDASFNFHSNRFFHTAIHLGKKPYKCDVCNKSFSQKGGLSIHKRTHTGMKPYKCQTCGARFSQLSHIQRHYRIHTGEKPYKCNICDFTSAQSANLLSHMDTHKKERKYKCSHCYRSFSVMQSLKKHISVLHNSSTITDL